MRCEPVKFIQPPRLFNDEGFIPKLLYYHAMAFFKTIEIIQALSCFNFVGCKRDDECNNCFTMDYKEYPLVTHDPNMLKNKSRGNLVGKIKVSLPEGKYENFC